MANKFIKFLKRVSKNINEYQDKAEERQEKEINKLKKEIEIAKLKNEKRKYEPKRDTIF